MKRFLGGFWGGVERNWGQEYWGFWGVGGSEKVFGLVGCGKGSFGEGILSHIGI